MPVTHEPWLVALSIIVAIQGAYVGLSLAVQIGDAVGMRRRLLLAGAAFSLGVAVWAMHFVAMLAARLAFPIDYLVFPTLLSFLVCVIVVGAAVYATSSGPLTPLRLILSAGLMGAGIFSMHYIGMAALHASAHMVHAPANVAASMGVAVAASGLALWLAAGRGGRPPLILSAIAFGIAVSGMHYTAMAGVTLFPHPTASSGAPALSTDLLAIVVAVVAFGVSGIFLLILVPDHTRPDPVHGVGDVSMRTATADTPEAPSQAVLAATRSATPARSWGAALLRRSAASVRRRGASRATCRSNGTAPPILSPWTTSSRSMPMRTTPTSSTATTSCFARSPSGTSNRGSTTTGSSGFIAAISSISSASSATSVPATTRWSRCMAGHRSRSAGAGSAC